MRLYLQKIEPHLPFKIESLHVDADWKDFYNGRIRKISVVLRMPPYRIHASGPLQLLGLLDTREVLTADYRPSVSIERIGITHGRSSAFPLDLNVRVSKLLTGVLGVRASTQVAELNWELYGLKAQGFQFDLQWDSSNPDAQLAIAASKLSWIEPKWLQGASTSPEEHAVFLEKLVFKANTPFQPAPLSIGPKSVLEWQLKNAKVVWGKARFDTPQDALEGKAKIDADQAAVRGLRLRLGPERKPMIQAEAQFESRKPDFPIRAGWRTASIPLQLLLERFTSLTGADLGDFEWSGGSVRSTGSGRMTGPRDFTVNTDIDLQGVSLRSREKGLLVRDFNLKLPLRWNESFTAEISAKRIALRKLDITLDPTSIQARRTGPAAFSFTLPQGPRLRIRDIPFASAPFQGELQLGPPFHYRLLGSVSLNPIDLTSLTRAFCISSKMIPPTTVNAQLSNLDIEDGSIVTDGTVVARVFEGTLELSEIGLYDLPSDVPETDFSVHLNNIDLSAVGRWLGFGEMDGKLTGHAEEVVMQAWLPTQYDFLVQVKPFHHNDIVFSPDAMKNVVRLFADEDINHIPGIASWFAFGWPSRMLGGYDVNYAGASIVSREGLILLETLDPPSVVQLERKHFFIYGPRFKMPLRNSNYPLVLDATSMSNFVRQMARMFENMRTNKEAAERQQGPKSPPEEERKNDEDECLPEGFDNGFGTR